MSGWDGWVELPGLLSQATHPGGATAHLAQRVRRVMRGGRRGPGPGRQSRRRVRGGLLRGLGPPWTAAEGRWPGRRGPTRETRCRGGRGGATRAGYRAGLGYVCLCVCVWGGGGQLQMGGRPKREEGAGRDQREGEGAGTARAYLQMCFRTRSQLATPTPAAIAAAACIISEATHRVRTAHKGGWRGWMAARNVGR